MYTIVQHSAYGYADKQDFRQGLEPRQVDARAAARVKRAGGVLMRTYKEAEDYCEREAYPRAPLMPHAPGKFSEARIDGLRIYIPVKEQAE